MQKTTLTFPSIQDLWQFKLSCTQCDFLMNTEKQTLTGVLSETDIQKAKEQFNATVLEPAS